MERKCETNWRVAHLPECQSKQSSTHFMPVCTQLGNVGSISTRCETANWGEIKCKRCFWFALSLSSINFLQKRDRALRVLKDLCSVCGFLLNGWKLSQPLTPHFLPERAVSCSLSCQKRSLLFFTKWEISREVHNDPCWAQRRRIILNILEHRFKRLLGDQTLFFKKSSLHRRVY